jgi:hypothetical protein
LVVGKGNWYYQYGANAADMHGNALFWWILIPSGIQLILMYISIEPFLNYYEMQVDLEPKGPQPLS